MGASLLPTSYQLGGLSSTESSTSGVRGTAPATKRVSCILEEPGGLSWNLLGASSGGMAPLKSAYGAELRSGHGCHAFGSDSKYGSESGLDPDTYSDSNWCSNKQNFHWVSDFVIRILSKWNWKSADKAEKLWKEKGHEKLVTARTNVKSIFADSV